MLAIRPPVSATLHAGAVAARSGGTSLPIAAALVHAAFASPETAEAVYAAFRNGWLGRADMSALPHVNPAPLSAMFWDAFWQLQSDKDGGAMDALAITSRVAGLGAFVDPQIRERAEHIAARHPKSAEPATRTPPPRLILAELERAPEDSLAHDFWRQIVDNGFDLEVLDRETMNLSSLPPALCYLNTRILQMHDIWHLVGGFHTTALHEIAISAFQQAQFDHGYSAMFLAAITSSMALSGGAAGPAILQTIAEASQYGADCPSFMAMPWDKEWHAPLAEIRQRHGIAAFRGTYPADFFERLRTAS